MPHPTCASISFLFPPRDFAAEVGDLLAAAGLLTIAVLVTMDPFFKFGLFCHTEFARRLSRSPLAWIKSAVPNPSVN